MNDISPASLSCSRWYELDIKDGFQQFLNHFWLLLLAGNLQLLDLGLRLLNSFFFGSFVARSVLDRRFVSGYIPRR